MNRIKEATKMNEAKFTKGDWKKCTMAMSPGDWAQLNSGKYPITIVCRGADVIAAVWGIEDEDEQANANLIAAAPEMYAALQQLCDNRGVMEWLEMHSPCIREVAEEALAKARGES